MKAPSEKHLEDWIVNNPQYVGDTFDEDEYPLLPHEQNVVVHFNAHQYTYPYISRILKRQPTFPYGRADLIATDEVSVSAIELKLGAIDGETIAQILRYMHALRHIYGTIAEREYITNKDAKAHLVYANSLMPESGSPIITGIVIGNTIKDPKILTLTPMLGINIVTYDYDPVANFYRFETHGTWVDMSGMIDAAAEYANGIIGDMFAQLIRNRIDVHKWLGVKQ